MAEVFSDNFNRADSDTIGGNWVEESGDLDIASNQLSAASTGVAYNTSTIGSDDYQCSIDFDWDQGGGTEWFFILGRCGAGTRYDNCYFYYGQAGGSDFTALYRRVAAAQTQLGSNDTTARTGTLTSYLKMQGTTISAGTNASETHSQTDSSHGSEGDFGIRLDAGAAIDNYSVDDLAVASTFTPKAIVF